MEVTPRKESEKIDKAIARLNTNWDLRIPRLRGYEAKTAGDSNKLGPKCASRIRAICWNGNIDIDSVLDDFEERAAQRHSKWIYKRAQQSGTFPSLSVTKSWLKRDAISRNCAITNRERETLLGILAELLEDEFTLIRQSDSYQRTSFASAGSKPESIDASTIQNQSFRSLDTSSSERQASHLRDSSHMAHPRQSAPKRQTNKRDAPNLVPAASKKIKKEPDRRQKTLQETISAFKSVPESNSTTNRRQAYAQVSTPNPYSGPVSFESLQSEDADRVFSQDEGREPSSNDTSILDESTMGKTEFSGGTQFEETVQGNNDTSSTSLQPVPITKSPQQMVDELVTAGPFRKVHPQFGPDTPFWLAWSLHSVCLNIEGSDRHVGPLYHKLRLLCEKDIAIYDDFKLAVKKYCRALSEKPLRLPHLPGLPAWMTDANNYEDCSNGRSVALSARLDFSRSPDNLFDLKLNPIAVDKSCNFHHMFGPDRFCTLDIPTVAPDHHKATPKALQNAIKPTKLHVELCKWLTQHDIYLAGRIWRFLYNEPKDAPKQKQNDEGFMTRFHFFAVNGYDFHATPRYTPRYRPISNAEVLLWHLKFKDNQSSTDLKLYSRLRLALSRTIRTVVLEPHEFIEVEDKKPRLTIDGPDIDNGQVMTDGNALISLELATAVSRSLGLGDKPPSVFQARIGGAKGTWTVDYDGRHQGVSERQWWIEITPSQLKIKPHPRRRLAADDDQRTFEVVKTSGVCTPGHLNSQLIRILDGCQVPRMQLDSLMREELQNYYDSLSDAVLDPIELRRFRQLRHPTPSLPEGIKWTGGMPDRSEDELDLLLDSGHHPRQCRYMIEKCLRPIVAQSLNHYREKNRIAVAQSTNLFCVPDPHGVLQPGEVQINFSQPVADFPLWRLRDRSCLVARNPANLASDIQKVTLVHRPELTGIEDVIIFPILGEFPLAGMLSGGDYDGDTISTFWDERLTMNFRESPVPSLPSKAECGIESENDMVSASFNTEQVTQQQVDAFLLKCAIFNGCSSRLGAVTNLLERVIYLSPRNLHHPMAIKLAKLASDLVDAPKQGDLLSTEAWNKIMADAKRAFKRLPLKLPYKSPREATARWIREDGQCVNILDHLKFDVIEVERERILTSFTRLIPEQVCDTDLVAPYSDECAYQKSLNPGIERTNLGTVLKKLKSDVSGLHDKWKQRGGKNEQLSFSKELGKPVVLDDWPTILNEFRDDLLTIRPLDVDCRLRTQFMLEENDSGSKWSLLRASCAYSESFLSSMSWKIAGEELCRIKARACQSSNSRTREVVGYMYDYHRIDTKRPRKLLAASDDYEEDDEEFWDAQE